MNSPWEAVLMGIDIILGISLVGVVLLAFGQCWCWHRKHGWLLMTRRQFVLSVIGGLVASVLSIVLVMVLFFSGRSEGWLSIAIVATVIGLVIISYSLFLAALWLRIGWSSWRRRVLWLGMAALLLTNLMDRFCSDLAIGFIVLLVGLAVRNPGIDRLSAKEKQKIYEDITKDPEYEAWLERADDEQAWQEEEKMRAEKDTSPKK